MFEKIICPKKFQKKLCLKKKEHFIKKNNYSKKEARENKINDFTGQPPTFLETNWLKVCASIYFLPCFILTRSLKINSEKGDFHYYVSEPMLERTSSFLTLVSNSVKVNVPTILPEFPYMYKIFFEKLYAIAYRLMSVISMVAALY